MSIIATAVIALVATWAVYAFNRLVRLRNQVRTAWADIDVQLTRRHDLAPQLVAAVKAYASHEQATLAAVTELRARAVSLRGPAQLGAVEAELEQALARLFALEESYPDLKANENYAQLHSDLVKIEDHLQYARRFYNGAVRDYNDGVQRIPDLLLARAFQFMAAEFYQAREAERAPVRVGATA